MIKKLIKIEFRKHVKYRTFWFLISTHCISILLLIIFLKDIIEAFEVSTPNKGVVVRSSLHAYFFFPKVWNTVTYVGGYFHILLGTIVIISICNEYSFNTLRQNIISGLSRKDFLLSKLIQGVILACYNTLLVFLISIVLGLISTKHPTWSKFLIQFEFIPLYFVQTIVFLIFSLFIGLLLKKSASALIFMLVYITLIENIFIFFIPASLKGYFPYSATSKLIPPPDHSQALFYTTSYITTIIAIGYCLLFIFGCYLLLSKKDL